MKNINTKIKKFSILFIDELHEEEYSSYIYGDNHEAAIIESYISPFVFFNLLESKVTFKKTFLFKGRQIFHYKLDIKVTALDKNKFYQWVVEVFLIENFDL